MRKASLAAEFPCSMRTGSPLPEVSLNEIPAWLVLIFRLVTDIMNLPPVTTRVRNADGVGADTYAERPLSTFKIMSDLT
jgi:hypothetical protein